MQDYLLDQQFLKTLDRSQERETYVRITSLSLNDFPREEIIGRATGGSINIDGASAVRRSCSLSMLALDTDPIVTDTYWCYNNKFKLEIGLKNLIDTKYPEIIWFEMGIYIITAFSKSKNTTGLNISLSGKDKMCRLNGEVSGNIMMSNNFGVIDEVAKVEEIDSNTGETNVTYHTTTTKLPIYTIIKNAVKEYGQERAENIIINDLDQFGYELWEYRGEEPFYLFIQPGYTVENAAVINMTFNGDTEVTFANATITTKISKFEEAGGKFYSMNILDKDYNDNATLVNFGKQQCYIAKINYGETAGYHQIPLVYNNDLILGAGETVTALLDKIKAMLGDFEYFYDLQGRFVFQKKNTYMQELFSPKDGELVTPTTIASKYSYRFEDMSQFTACANTPNINNLKNDFSIWGNIKSATGQDLPIHVRYAIHKKPDRYCSLPYYKDGKLKERSYVYTSQRYDWRELIYRMAIDFYRHNQEPDYLIKLEELNPTFIDGRTGYEQYYSDIQTYWRQLYSPTPTEWELKQYGEYYDSKGSDGQGNDAFWNKKIHLNPNNLEFWIDFLDIQGDLTAYSIDKIGTRSKVVNEKGVNSIYFKETPEVLFIVSPKETLDNVKMAYMPIWIQDSMANLFYKSAQGASAISKANELIYQHTASIEGISLTSIPIYYLQPNPRIYVKDWGDYSLDKITYSLTYNGTMTLTGNKIIKQFY